MEKLSNKVLEACVAALRDEKEKGYFVARRFSTSIPSSVIWRSYAGTARKIE